LRNESATPLAFASRSRDGRPSLALVHHMTVIPDATSSPTLPERWIKANIAAAIIAAMASFAVYLVKQAVGTAQPGMDGLVILVVVALPCYGFSGLAGGVLTGAVLQRVVRGLPVRTWIALHAAMSAFAGVAVELMDTSRGDRASDALALDPGVLPSSIVFGAIMGTIAGGLEALVMRPVANGLGAWVKWSAIAYAAAWVLLVTGSALLQPDGTLTGEILNEALSFAAAVIIALLTLPGLAALQPRAS
jgi:hypothetical protein